MGRLLGCIGCFFKGTDHILTQAGRGMGTLLGCIHILTQLGRGMGRLLGCSGCFFQGTDHILSQGEEWEGFLGCSGSYPHPIRERNRKAPGLHLEGHRSYPHPIRERNGKVSLAAAGHILTQLGRGMGRQLGLHLEGPKSYPHPNWGEEWEGFLAESAAFSRAQIISSPN